MRTSTQQLAMCLMAFCFLSTPNLAVETKTLKIGDPAPNFELKGTDGSVHKLADFKDKSAVVVAWYPKALTGG